MRLLTKKIENEFKNYPLYSQDGVEDKKVLCKFFCVYNNMTWYVTEASRENNDWTFFGLVTNQYGEREYGYFTLGELMSTKVNYHGFAVDAVERDDAFEPTMMSEIRELKAA